VLIILGNFDKTDEKAMPPKVGGRKCVKWLCPRIPGAVVLAMLPNVGAENQRNCYTPEYRGAT